MSQIWLRTASPVDTFTKASPTVGDTPRDSLTAHTICCELPPTEDAALDRVRVGGRLVDLLIERLRLYEVDVVSPGYLIDVDVVLVLKDVPGLGVAE